jgi:drug/metabolite transporter (DMT)-like permease
MTAGDRASTIGGIIAVVLWSASVAFSRTLTESLGVFSASAFSCLLAGSAGVLHSLLSKGGRAQFSSLPAPYLAFCGTLFVVYSLCLYLAIGLAPTNASVVEVGVINYLWPVLTLVLSIPLLKVRARLWVIPGFLLALSGTVLAVGGPDVLNPRILADLSSRHSAVMALALGAAVSWALYSNLARKFGSATQGNAAPLFFLCTGALMLLLRFVFGEESHWSARTALTLLFMALGPGLIAYTLWDKAMRKGDLVLVTVLSYFTPLLSTAITCACLEVLPPWTMWLACAMLIAGALLSKWSLHEA